METQKYIAEVMPDGHLSLPEKVAKSMGLDPLTKVRPKLSDFLLDLRRSLAHKGFAKILMHQDLSTYLRKKSLNLG